LCTGSYADYCLVKEEWLAHAPQSLKLDTAAGAVPLASLTAFQVRPLMGLETTSA
jgi:NADPH:quinone reductase-like Zn-dependent oxidoreductase